MLKGRVYFQARPDEFPHRPRYCTACAVTLGYLPGNARNLQLLGIPLGWGREDDGVITEKTLLAHSIPLSFPRWCWTHHCSLLFPRCSRYRTDGGIVRSASSLRLLRLDVGKGHGSVERQRLPESRKIVYFDHPLLSWHRYERWRMTCSAFSRGGALRTLTPRHEVHSSIVQRAAFKV